MTNVEAPVVAKAGPTPKTLWGKPDPGSGREKLTSAERLATPTGIFTDEQRAELDRLIRRRQPGRKADGRETEQTSIPVHRDLHGASSCHKRTSLIVDPPMAILLTPGGANSPRRCASSNCLLEPTASCKENHSRMRYGSDDRCHRDERSASGLERAQYGWNQPR
jgi:hypothetical protein